MFAFFSTSISIGPQLALATANSSGVKALSSIASTFAPESSKILAHRVLSCSIAKCNAVCPLCLAEILLKQVSSGGKLHKHSSNVSEIKVKYQLVGIIRSQTSF